MSYGVNKDRIYLEDRNFWPDKKHEKILTMLSHMGLITIPILVIMKAFN